MAGSREAPTPTFSVLSKIPGADHPNCEFGREGKARTRLKKLTALLDLPNAVASVGGLIWYIR